MQTVTNEQIYDRWGQVPDELKEACVASISVLYWKVMEDRIMRQIKSEGGKEED